MDQVKKFERLFADYVARFGMEPEWNLQPVEQQIAAMENALRLNRPIPEEPVSPDVLI
jgi:hypothetical protein